jgi:hypothetical protein
VTRGCGLQSAVGTVVARGTDAETLILYDGRSQRIITSLFYGWGGLPNLVMKCAAVGGTELSSCCVLLLYLSILIPFHHYFIVLRPILFICALSVVT